MSQFTVDEQKHENVKKSSKRQQQFIAVKALKHAFYANLNANKTVFWQVSCTVHGFFEFFVLNVLPDRKEIIYIGEQFYEFLSIWNVADVGVGIIQSSG